MDDICGIAGTDKMKEDGVLGSTEEAKTTSVAEKAMENPDLLTELFAGISSTDPKTKFGCAKTHRMISEKRPQTLYSKMDFFVSLLDSKNAILRWTAMDVIANLAAVDVRDRFDGLFRRFYGCLYEGSLITAGHVVDGSGKVALSKPELREKVTDELLKVEGIPLPTSECRNILVGKAIDAFSAYYDMIEDKDRVASFVKRQLSNSRNATRNRAEKFLRKHVH